MTITLHEFDGEYSMTFSVGELGADVAIEAAGHEPNGYFWEGVVQFEWPDLASKLALDSEGSMFCAVGAQGDLAALEARIAPLLSDADAVAQVIARADAAGFEFDD